MKKTFLSFLYFTCLSALSLQLCCFGIDVHDLNADDFVGDVGPIADPDATPGFFETDIVPLFASNDVGPPNCASTGCHGGGSTQGAFDINFQLGDAAGPDTAQALYDVLTEEMCGAGKPFIDTNDPDNSCILSKGLGMDSHGGGNPFGDTNNSVYIALRNWIVAGASFD